jgi:hypothetical protein
MNQLALCDLVRSELKVSTDLTEAGFIEFLYEDISNMLGL